MKKLFTFLLLLFLCFFVGLRVYSQNANEYVFSYTTGSYSEISGGTVLGVTANDDQSFIGTTTGGNSLQTGTGFPIGFNFYYRGFVFDKFAVCTNGWIRLGTGTFSISSTFTPLSSTLYTTENVFAAIARDLNGQTGSELSFLLTGTSPNQCMVIQWKNYRRFNLTGESYNFQIRLYEGTNQIQIVYGPFTVNFTGTSHPQVGIKGLTNTDYHNRTTTTNWSNTTKGAANTATCTLTTTVKPAPGATYTFTIPAGPSGPTSFTATPVSPSQIDLAFTLDYPNNDSVLIVYSSPTNTITTPSGTPPAAGQSFAGGTVVYKGKTSPVNHTSLTENTLYWYKAFSYSLGIYSSGALQSATTFCNGNTIYPFTESFNGTTFPPSCWTTVKTAGTSTTGIWDRQTAGTYPTCTPHSGAGMTRYNCWSFGIGTKGILVSAPLNLPSYYCYVKFWMYRDPGYPLYADLVNVYFNTTNNLSGATLLGTVNRSMSLAPVVATEGWYEYNYNLPPASFGDNRYIIFEAVSDYGNNIFLDDVVISSYDPNSVPVANWTLILAAGLIVMWTVFLIRRRG